MASENITRLSQTAEQFCTAYRKVEQDGLVDMATSMAALDSRSKRQEKQLTALSKRVEDVMTGVSRAEEMLKAWQIPAVDQKLTPPPVAAPPAAPETKKPIEHIRDEMCWSTLDETYYYIMNMDERTLDMVLASSGMAVVPKKHKKKKARVVTIEAKRMCILRELEMDYLYPPKAATETAATQSLAEHPTSADSPGGNDAGLGKPKAPSEDDDHAGHRRAENGNNGDIKDKDVEMVMAQTSISRDKAVEALKENGNDAVNTIMTLSLRS
ncbi:hypothetical protein LEL_10683 [Akanthomyces lecanii RCEF 1005]|uniref:Nascent polypeptide-associated complex subunit alpha-like UBA domain-containing protein n=1 Tax=Akanthomyces lecanii RCEF 1005 TaxID=1081108 RepID=A0A167W1H9_CORDF|nr:hypothetical protein LEL_10683 [Akanthomyces lecanii RCEF 1005]